MGDLRKSTRLAFDGKISMTWSDAYGHCSSRNGECLDVSASGLKVKLDAQIPVRTVVSVQSKELALHGSASVRTCTRDGVRYLLGLEFLGGMKWQLTEAVAEAGDR